MTITRSSIPAKKDSKPDREKCLRLAKSKNDESIHEENEVMDPVKPVINPIINHRDLKN